MKFLDTIYFHFRPLRPRLQIFLPIFKITKLLLLHNFFSFTALFWPNWASFFGLRSLQKRHGSSSIWMLSGCFASTSVMLPNQGQSHVCPSQRSHRGCGSISKMLRNDGLLQRKCAIPKSLPPSYSRTVIIVHQFYGQFFDRFQCQKKSLEKFS